MAGRVSVFGWRRDVHRLVVVLAVFALAVMQLGAPGVVAAHAATGAPTISSDRLDYSAGSTVHLTGSNWQAGESVKIDVNDTKGDTWRHAATVTALDDGTVTDAFQLPGYFVSDYDVTATGPVSGVAKTAFTDAPAAVNLDQCRNGSASSPNDCKDFGGNTGWVNGNVGASQAHMLEGYSTAFRAVMTNLPTNTAITLVIGYDIRNSGANAYDYLTQYQRLEPHAYFGHPAETVYPTDGVTGFSSTTGTFAIPAPSSAGSPVAGEPTASFNSLPAAQRVMTLFGGTISAMSYVSQGSLTANQSETQIAVTFTSDDTTAVLAWGGHISQCSVWGTTNGTCNSAGGISGSPYHMRLISWSPNLPNLGNTDRSMAAAVVVQPGNLTLAKTLTGGPAGYTGPFTVNYDCGTGYVGSVSVSSGSSKTVNGIPSGSVCTVSETPPTAPSGYSFGVPTFTPSASVTIGQGTTVTVTTNNTLSRDLGSLKIIKNLTGGPEGFTGPFTIHYDCGAGYTGDVSVAAGASQTVDMIPSGTMCTVSETLPPAPSSYTFGAPTFSPSDTVTIGSGTTVTVTTNNTLVHDTGSLKITKSLTGGPESYTGPFTINYDCGTGYTGTVSVAAGASQTVGKLPSGTVCTVSETTPTAPTGYSFGTPTFTPSDSVTITANTTVEVTTNNTLTRDTGSLKITKSLTGGPEGYTGPFTIGYDCGAGYSGSVSVASGASQTVSGIPSGSECTMSETAPTAPTGYTFGTPTFSPSDTVTIGANTIVEVTVNNVLARDTGSLTISKTLANPDGASVPASFTMNYDCGAGYTGSVDVATDKPATVSGIPTGSTCTVSEAALTPIAGYTWGTPTVTPASVVIADTTGTFTLTVANAITRDLGTLTVAKTLSNPDGAAVPSSFTINYDCGTGYIGSVSVAAGGSATVNGIPTGNTCTVSEAALTPIAGYTWGTPTVTPASVVIADTTGTFTLTVANSITRDTGSLQISKTVSNPDGATLPAAFTINYDCGTGYTGSVSVAAGGSATVNGIPTGSTCTVSEAALTPIAGYTWGTPTVTPASVVIADTTGTFTLTVANSITRDRGILTVAKTLSNPDGAAVPASFTINYECGTGYTGSVSVAAGASQAVSGIPTGNTCTVSEAALTPIAGYTWGTPTVTPASVVIADTTGTFTLTVANSITRDTGSLQISKTVSNPDGAAVPSSFTIKYDCGSGYTGSVSVAAAGSATVSGIPTGSTCTVSEAALTPIAGYTWSTPTVTPASVVIATKTGTFTLTVANSITRDNGSLKITKTVSGASFSGTFSVVVVCTDGNHSTGYNSNIVYPTPGFVTIAEIPSGSSCEVTEPTFPSAPSGYAWGSPTITGSPAIVVKDQVVTVSVANVLQTGHARVVKTVGSQPVTGTNNCLDVSGNVVGCTFQLRSGASTTQQGTVLESKTTLLAGQPVGTLDFTSLLTPGQTYQVCEIILPGWLTSLGTFVPGSFMPPDGVAPNPSVDNSILCGNFVAQADTTVNVGNVFTIDNTPPPGGRGLTIGFWKNWASCTSSSTNKTPILDETLAKAEPNGVVVSATSGTYPAFGTTYYLVLHGSTTKPKAAPSCLAAVNLLNKTTIDGKKKMASDPAFNLAAQLTAAELNYAAGAGKKPAVTSAIQQAVLLLGKYSFNGLTHTTITAADASTMNTVAATLDNYNNNRL